MSESYVHNHFFPSPLGWIGVAFTARGQVERLSVYPGSPSDDTLIFSPQQGSQPLIINFLKNQLNDYFRLACRSFNVPLFMAGNALEQKVWPELLTLQFGKCVELPIIAQRVGELYNLEGVAKAIRSNPIAILVPSHRVLNWELLAPCPENNEWLNRLRYLEDIVPGESTCMLFSSMPSTPREIARAAALSPPAQFKPAH